ncbi:MAG: hypothetical protein ACP5G5_03470 [Thermoplasmata archaeon]|jgi:hypothetical protein
MLIAIFVGVLIYKFIVKVEYDVTLNLSPSTIERRKKFCTNAERFEIYG